MAQTSYEEYLKAILGDTQAPMAPMAPVTMPDISNIQEAMQGVQNVNQSYVAPKLTDLGMFRTQFEEGRRQAAEEVLAQALGVSPAGGLFSGDGESPGISPEQAAYFDIQSEAERDLAMQQFQKAVTPIAIQAILGKSAPVLSGKTNYNIRSEALKNEIAKQVAAIPDVVTPSSGSFSGGWNDGGTGVGVGGGPVGAGGGNAAGGYSYGGW